MAVIIPIKVHPQAGRQALVWDAKSGRLKAFLKSAPEKNKANDELCILLSKTLGIARSCIVIIGGHTARQKKVAITSALSASQIAIKCGMVGVQQTI